MLSRLPVEVNPFRLVEQRKRLHGLMPSGRMSRLQEVVLPETDDFTVEMDFTRSISGLPMISGYVRGCVVVECQRCMQPVQIDVDSTLEVALTSHQADERPEQEGLEAWLVEDERLFLQDFVEDEVLLALPLVAKHEQCEPARELIEALPTDLPANESTQTDDDNDGQAVKKNPFAVLKDWKKTE